MFLDFWQILSLRMGNQENDIDDLVSTSLVYIKTVFIKNTHE